ncbi:unnamed protein product [Lymnaea stagnalis]|uniref:H15 domain-containing protein n=1 Tax=Lymnaea stagnalis TaxID=6523 RepID=A0AAV2I242_LYMST
MPAIKKKWIKASQDGADAPEDNDIEPVGDEDKDATGTGESTPTPVKKPQKRSAHSPQHLLRGLDGEVLLEKRKRFIPPAELKLSEWYYDNLEQRTEETLHLPNLYKYYTELCQAESSDVLDLQQFSRTVKDKFGKSFGIKANSVYKALIKEKKLNKEKKKSGIKMKEVVHEAINHFGNPWGGVRFFALKTYIGTKYPAIQIDLRPKILKRALEMGVQYGQIDLVKGIGMAGFYKLPGGEPPSPKKKENKEEGEEKEKEKDGESAEGIESVDEKDPESKAADENGEKKEEGEEVKTKKLKQSKNKWSLVFLLKKVSYSSINHGDPQKIEDTFPLAITYQSAPKAVAATRIRRYIQEKYDEIVQDNRWRKAIESGVDKGYWEYASGSGISGKLHLLMDDFDPNSNSIEDRICAAIIACHEPKAASANQIKKYISQYHPDFKVDERPDLFKKALQRAISKNIITQLSGLGASGSFQLTSHFIPSPLVLAGENDSDEEGDNDSGNDSVYIPKGTKSRGVPKVKTLAVVHSPPSKSRKNKPLKKTIKSKGKETRFSDESDSDSQSQKPKGKQSTPKGKQGKAKSSSKKPAAQSASSDEGEEEVKDEPEYTPRKSQSRGGSLPAKATKNGRQKTKKTDSVLEDDDDDEEIQQDLEYTPRKSKSRGGVGKSSAAKSDEDQRAPKKAKSKAAEKVVSEPKKNARKTPSKPSEVQHSDEEEQQVKKKAPKSASVDEEASGAEDPKGKKNGRKRKAPDTVVHDDGAAVEPKGKKNARKSKSKDENLSDDEEPEYTPRKSKSRESQIEQQQTPSDKKKRSRVN